MIKQVDPIEVHTKRKVYDLEGVKALLTVREHNSWLKFYSRLECRRAYELNLAKLEWAKNRAAFNDVETTSDKVRELSDKVRGATLDWCQQNLGADCF